MNSGVIIVYKLSEINRFIYIILFIFLIKGDFFMKTIAVNEDIHQKISEFGHKNETYNQILERLYNSAIEVEFAQLLLSTQDTTDVNDLPW